MRCRSRIASLGLGFRDDTRDKPECRRVVISFTSREHRLSNPAFIPGTASRLVDRLYQWPSVLLTLTAIFWAGNAIASRLAVGHISPFLLVFLRWVLVLAVLWPLYGGQVREHWPEIRPRLMRITLMAIFGFTGFNALFYTAGYYTSAINIGILQGSIPVVVLAGAFLMYGTRATLVQIAGVLITTDRRRRGGDAGHAAVDPGDRFEPGRSRHAGGLRALCVLHDRAARPAEHARASRSSRCWR